MVHNSTFNKIITGWVTQVYNVDGNCIRQNFTGGEDVAYEDDAGEVLDDEPDAKEHPMNLVQPGEACLDGTAITYEPPDEFGPYLAFRDDRGCLMFSISSNNPVFEDICEFLRHWGLDSVPSEEEIASHGS